MRLYSLAAVLALMLGTIGCSKSGRFLYAVGPGTNSVLGFQVAERGSITPLSSGFGTDSIPVAVLVHPDGLFAWAANFSGGNISLFNRSGNGTLTAATDPTTGLVLNPVNVGANPIAMAMNPSGLVLYVLSQNCALTPGPGTAPCISGFGIDNTSGNLTPLHNSPFFITLAANSGSVPVSITVTPNSKFVYYADSGKGNVGGFLINADGSLTALAGSPFSVGTAPSFVAVDPQAKFLYVADPPSNQIFAFTIDPNSGAPSSISGSPFAAGTNPTGLAIDSTGDLLLAANKGSNNVSAYSLNGGTGALSQISGSPFTTGAAPVFVIVDSTNNFVYVADSGSNDISAFALTNGTLQVITGSPFNIATSPSFLTSR
jgi:6-phosphogluconolactonase